MPFVFAIHFNSILNLHTSIFAGLIHLPPLSPAPGSLRSEMEGGAPQQQQQQQQQPNATHLQAEFTSAVHRWAGHAASNSRAEQQQMRDHQGKHAPCFVQSTQVPC